jgi:SPP1 gp7 family putative phage head morphogenesis protein
MFKYAAEYIEKLIKGIFDGDITEHDLPTSLYHEIAEYLKAGLYKGYGMTLKESFGTSDHELLSELRENIYAFSAAKTYQQVRDMTDKLTNSDGEVIPFNEFKEEAGQIFDTYNNDYLKTEYNTAIGQGQMAIKWNEIQANKDILPFLEYSTIGDACDICAPLDGFTAPVDDPAWDTIMPLNHFNCECIVEQLDQEEGESKETPETDRDETLEKVTGRMNDVFKMNPGKDAVIFSPDHPYFTVPKADRDFARANFNLPIPKKD